MSVHDGGKGKGGPYAIMQWGSPLPAPNIGFERFNLDYTWGSLSHDYVIGAHHSLSILGLNSNLYMYVEPYPLLDPSPDDSCHLISIQFDYWLRNLNPSTSADYNDITRSMMQMQFKLNA